MGIVVMAMTKVWIPIFCEKLANKDFKKIDNLAYNYSKYIFFTAIGLILFSKEIVSLMAGEKYHSALPIVPIIVIGYVGVFLYTIVIIVFIKKNRTNFYGYTFYWRN